MDGSHFDRWTRRRFGLLAGGVTASLFGVLAVAGDDSAARNNRKKRRKRRRQRRLCSGLGETCAPGGRACCADLLCEATNQLGDEGFHCCKGLGEPCQTDEECCRGLNLICFRKEGATSDSCVDKGGEP